MSTATINHQVRLAQRPVGTPGRECWSFTSEPVPQPVPQPDVGGEILDTVLTRINRKARIIICGAISQYNNTTAVQGPKNYLSLLVNRARMEGIVVFDYAERYHLAVAEMAGYLKDGRMKSKEDVMSGLQNFPETLLKLFNGENFGKRVLEVAKT